MKETMQKMQCLLAVLLIAGAAFAQEREAQPFEKEDTVLIAQADEALPEAEDEEVADEDETDGEAAAEDETSLDKARIEMQNDGGESDDEPYLSDADEDAILDSRADKIIEGEIAQERKADASPDEEGDEEEGENETDEEEKYIVRVEVYARPSTPYIPLGDVSLEEGFFCWYHDGKHQNGYAVFMYPADSDESAIKTTGKGAYCVYAKSFETVEAASQEIQGPDTEFSKRITYKPVIDAMLDMLQKPPYQEEVEYDNGEYEEGYESGYEAGYGDDDSGDENADADSADNADDTDTDDADADTETVDDGTLDGDGGDE